MPQLYFFFPTFKPAMRRASTSASFFLPAFFAWQGKGREKRSALLPGEQCSRGWAPCRDRAGRPSWEVGAWQRRRQRPPPRPPAKDSQNQRAIARLCGEWDTSPCVHPRQSRRKRAAAALRKTYHHRRVGGEALGDLLLAVFRVHVGLKLHGLGCAHETLDRIRGKWNQHRTTLVIEALRSGLPTKTPLAPHECPITCIQMEHLTASESFCALAAAAFRSSGV